jgi:hypothetical protein
MKLAETFRKLYKPMKHFDIVISIKACDKSHTIFEHINFILLSASLTILWLILWFDVLFRLVPR